MTMAKRSIESASGSSKRRVKPTPVQSRPFTITNLKEGETVHQTCIVANGECQDFDNADESNFLSVASTDGFNQAQPIHNWPLNKGQWKALVMLVPGINKISFKLNHCGGISGSLDMTVNYVPLLQLPPLHLAILVAKDSPLLTDCPPAKYGHISTTHSSLDAAISKFRMSAYMWQAATAEDFRQKGLGRRSFRLEEEWSPNTTMQSVHQASSKGSTLMGTVPKVHIIRSDKTVAEIRDADVAQQNPHGRDRDALHQYFESALLDAGLPFESRHRPVVAGLILDSHYSNERSMILGHAALGCHKPNGVSLGVFGSHLTYSWPRFLQEIPACLTDSTPTGDTVGNDNGECDTMRGACFVGQGAFLHEVGHAFGAAHTSGIMARGYSQSWAMNFIDHETNNNLVNDAKWDLRDVLKFKMLPHFALPGDSPMSKDHKGAAVKIQCDIDRIQEARSYGNENDGLLKVSCAAGIVRVTIQTEGEEPKVVFTNDTWDPQYTLVGIDLYECGYDCTEAMKISAIGMNGKERVVADARVLLKERPCIFIPGSTVALQKESVRSDCLESGESGQDYVRWAMLLNHRGKDGKLHRATSIDLRVGCTMDGAVVHYADGQHENCGPARNRHTGRPHAFGGHASERHDLPVGEQITEVRVCRGDNGWGSLAGIRMKLSNGDEWGHLNDTESDSDDEREDGEGEDPAEQDESVVVLKPGEDEVIVGFFGQSDAGSGYTHEFGILTAPKDIVIPEYAYGMAELSNL